MRVCVCVHIYKYIFFNQTILQIPPDITVKQKSQYPPNVPELIPRTSF